ncbi:hypothetical protein PtA15_2A629 [Puccinia triticina]|uniref:Uncharacterized protein n=1 Tax=Puccinia triticina TaxID=208348 RepID=A0ABY7CCY2_9BASI|nr:uncharacterized protein PtA15_2A629 [Puccinia triticina]WAQ82312.1 hypothetical protein PtA15_2A629 [Puccinia triticina]
MAYPIRGGSINRGGMSNRMEQDRYRAAARAGLSAAIVQSRSATNGQVDRNRIGGQRNVKSKRSTSINRPSQSSNHRLICEHESQQL